MNGCHKRSVIDGLSRAGCHRHTSDSDQTSYSGMVARTIYEDSVRNHRRKLPWMKRQSTNCQGQVAIDIIKNVPPWTNRQNQIATGNCSPLSLRSSSIYACSGNSLKACLPRRDDELELLSSSVSCRQRVVSDQVTSLPLVKRCKRKRGEASSPHPMFGCDDDQLTDREARVSPSVYDEMPRRAVGFVSTFRTSLCQGMIEEILVDDPLEVALIRLESEQNTCEVDADGILTPPFERWLPGKPRQHPGSSHYTLGANRRITLFPQPTHGHERREPRSPSQTRTSLILATAELTFKRPGLPIFEEAYFTLFASGVKHSISLETLTEIYEMSEEYTQTSFPRKFIPEQAFWKFIASGDFKSRSASQFHIRNPIL
ncbi:hypothetical protein F2Q70_00036073 [Brassica cretica]|uniref:Uncharacterized protein n=1 Tax=Brassica cretica TaxID=69181 RepID=A0A8S9JS12_BRACR|nr:hypothetical protein F2Q70_00036073 [Brassica cretica]